MINEEKKLRFFLSKRPDVPTYVEYGAADIDVTGKDTLWRRTAMFMKFLTLGSENAGLRIRIFLCKRNVGRNPPLSARMIINPVSM
jgi:ATP phosphoribosyltransferase